MSTYNKEMEVDKTFIDCAPLVALAIFLGTWELIFFRGS